MNNFQSNGGKFIGATILAIILLSCNSSRSRKIVKNQELLSLEGIVATDITQSLKQRGFSVFSPEIYGENTGTWECITSTGDYSVRILTDSKQRIYKIDANMIFDRSDPGSKEFLGFLSSLPYNGSYPAIAKDWAMDQTAAGGDTTISGVNFRIDSVFGKSRTIEIYSGKSLK